MDRFFTWLKKSLTNVTMRYCDAGLVMAVRMALVAQTTTNRQPQDRPNLATRIGASAVIAFRNITWSYQID